MFIAGEDTSSPTGTILSPTSVPNGKKRSVSGVVLMGDLSEVTINNTQNNKTCTVFGAT